MLREEKEQTTHEQLTIIQRLMTAIEVAEILGISAKTVHKLARDRKLGCVQVTATDRRFTEEQVQTYITAQSQKPLEVRIDRPRARRVSSDPKKGGDRREYPVEKAKDSWASLQEEMSRWT